MARRDGKLSSEAARVLRLIARGHSYEQVLTLEPTLTYRDIFGAAEEALALCSVDKKRSRISEHQRNVRHDYLRAYEIWTVREDEQLTRMVGAGQSVEAIAAQLQRQPTAITSRMVKLGLAGTTVNGDSSVP
jgi:hypothetical protein